MRPVFNTVLLSIGVLLGRLLLLSLDWNHNRTATAPLTSPTDCGAQSLVVLTLLVPRTV
jgi:hypothetical protein